MNKKIEKWNIKIYNCIKWFYLLNKLESFKQWILIESKQSNIEVDEVIKYSNSDR